MTTLNSKEITLCSDSVDLGVPSACGVCIFIYALVFPYIFLYLPLSLNDNIEQWRDHSVLWQCWPVGSICLWCLYLYICTGISLYFLISAFESHWQHWTVKEITLCSESVDWGGPSAFETQRQHWTVKRSLCALSVLTGRGSIWLWCLYLHICTGISLYFLISAFESQWQHWTVKRSLCALTVLTRGHPSAFESHWQHWTVKRSLCALTVLPGGPSACGVCIFIYALVFPYIFLYLPLSLNDKHWTVKRSLCALTEFTGRASICLWCLYLYTCTGISLYFLISAFESQWDSTLNSDEITAVLWQCWPGGHPSAFECHWEHWTAKRSLCALDSVAWRIHLPVLSVSSYMHWYFLIFSYICLWVSMTTLNSEEITLCSDSADREASICLWVSLTTLNSKEITLCSDSVARGSICLWCMYALYMHWYFLIFSYICLWVSMITLNSEEITLCSDSVDRGASICLWVSLTTLNSKEITLCSDIVARGSICLWCLYLHICTGISLYFLISAFESQWQHWTVKRSLCALTVLTREGPSACGVCIFIYALVFPYIFLYLPLSLNDKHWTVKRSLCALTVLTGGHPSAFESHWQHWTVKRSLCALTVLHGGSICLWCLYLYICTGISLYFLISAFESQWQHWTVKRSLLCSDSVDQGGSIYLWCLYLYICIGISLYFLISAFESQWQHWTVKRSLCALTVLTGGHPYACGVCIFIYALVFPYIFLYLPLSLNDNIEKWRDHSVLWQCWGEGPYAWGVCIFIYALVFPYIFLYLPLSLIDNIEQQRDHSVLLTVLTGGIHLPVVTVSLYMHWYFLIISYICLWVSMTTLNSEEIFLCSDSVDLGGIHLPVVSVSLYMHWYFLIFSYICLWVWMTTLNSEEITLCSDSVDWGGIHLPLSLIDNIEQQRDHSVLLTVLTGRGSICLWWLYLYICTGISL